MLQIKDLSKRYGKKKVLEDISLTLEDCNYGLLGPNGSGKTTLFRIITGLIPADGGVVTAGTQRQALRIGYLPQRFGTFSHLTVEEQLRYFARLKQQKGDGISWEDEIAAAVKMANLTEQSKLKCGALSGGMVRRLGIAQALMGQPDLILLDEPTAGLDIEERLRLKEILDRIHGKQPLLLSTHILEDVRDVCRKIIVLSNKRIAFQGEAAALKEKARGRIGILSEADYLQRGGQWQVIAHFEREGKRFVRAYSREAEVISGGYAEPAEPTVEDGYLLLLNEERHDEARA